jgi:hypothetical protein
MDDALGPDVPAEGKGADDQSADRYAIGAQLSQDDCVQTFRATDRWLDRPVAMVFETGSGKGTLAETGQAVSDVPSPNLVEIYERSDSAAHPFVVCELPMSTVASLVQNPDQSLWNEGWATKTAEQLASALADLHRSGVEIAGVHFGYIGIDGSGRVRLSPWPLAEPPDAWPAPASEQDLVASVIESGIRVTGSHGSSKVAELVASLPPTLAGDVALTPDLLPASSTDVEPSVDDKPMREAPITPDFLSGTLAGVKRSVDDKPMREAPITTDAALLSRGASSPLHRGRRRQPWPLAAGVCLTGLAAFLAFSLVSSNPPAPANASTNALKSTSSTIAGLQLPVTPMSAPATTVPPSTTTTLAQSKTTTTASGAGGGAVPPVGTVPTATDAPSTTTTTVLSPTTTTTQPPSTTTTTAPPPTTTTTEPPSTTTTTAPPPTTTTTAGP